MEELKPAATDSENAAQEQGYPVAYDRKEQKAKGVRDITADGELETLEANETSKGQFIRVDRYENFFISSGKNFMYQYNHPAHYTLYRMEGKILMEEVKRRIGQGQLPENGSLRHGLSRDNQTHDNHLFNEREINWQQAERYGLTPDVLRQTDDMEGLLRGRQSDIAYNISINTELGRQGRDARLSLFRDENGLVKFGLHFVRQVPRVGQEYREYKLEEDVLDALNRTGNAGRLVNLVVNFHSKETGPCYLSRDPVTDEMFFLSADQVRCSKEIKGYTLSQQECDDYTAGKEVPIEFKSPNGKILRTSIQISATERGVEFLRGRSTKKLGNRQRLEQKDGLPERTQKPERRTYTHKSRITPKT